MCWIWFGSMVRTYKEREWEIKMEKIIIELVNEMKGNNRKFEVTVNTKIEDLQLTSLEFVRLIVNVEEKFNVEFEFDDMILTKYKTVNDLIRVVKNRLNYV